jgi:biopolymer transport protein ExbD
MYKRRKRRKMIPVPVASMGDIAFLLIIFFMVCSQFVKDPGVKISPPTTAKVGKLENYPIIVLIDHESKIYFQGTSIDSAAQIESEVRNAIGDRTDDKSRTVLFRCDKAVDKRVFEPVIEAIAKGGGRIAAVGDQSTDR